MADYQLTSDSDTVLRTADQARIPNASDNSDWIKYQEWLAAGGVPDPVPAPINPSLDTKPAKTAAEILGVT